MSTVRTGVLSGHGGRRCAGRAPVISARAVGRTAMQRVSRCGGGDTRQQLAK